VGLSRDLSQVFVWNLDSITRSLAKIGLACQFVGAFSGEAAAAPLTVAVQLGDPDQRLLDDLRLCQTELLEQPDNGALLFRAGVLLSQLGRDTEARESFTRAVEGGAYYRAPIELAACEIRLGHWVEGLAILERTLAAPGLIPRQSAALHNLIAWYLNLAPAEYRDPQRALASVHKALELGTERIRYLDTLGLALYRQHELPLAIETLRNCLRTAAMPDFDLYVLALCYQAAGEARRAADFTSRADYLLDLQAESIDRQRRAELLSLREEYVRGLAPSSE